MFTSPSNLLLSPVKMELAVVISPMAALPSATSCDKTVNELPKWQPWTCSKFLFALSAVSNRILASSNSLVRTLAAKIAMFLGKKSDWRAFFSPFLERRKTFAPFSKEINFSPIDDEGLWKWLFCNGWKCTFRRATLDVNWNFRRLHFSISKFPREFRPSKNSRI